MAKKKTFVKHPPSMLYKDSSLYLKATNLRQIGLLELIGEIWEGVESGRVNDLHLEERLTKIKKECNL